MGQPSLRRLPYGRSNTLPVPPRFFSKRAAIGVFLLHAESLLEVSWSLRCVYLPRHVKNVTIHNDNQLKKVHTKNVASLHRRPQSQKDTRHLYTTTREKHGISVCDLHVLCSSHLAPLVFADLHRFRQHTFIKVIIACGCRRVSLVQVFVFVHEKRTAVVVSAIELMQPQWCEKK